MSAPRNAAEYPPGPPPTTASWVVIMRGQGRQEGHGLPGLREGLSEEGLVARADPPGWVGSISRAKQVLRSSAQTSPSFASLSLTNYSSRLSHDLPTPLCPPCLTRLKTQLNPTCRRATAKRVVPGRR